MTYFLYPTVFNNDFPIRLITGAYEIGWLDIIISQVHDAFWSWLHNIQYIQLRKFDLSLAVIGHLLGKVLPNPSLVFTVSRILANRKTQLVAFNIDPRIIIIHFFPQKSKRHPHFVFVSKYIFVPESFRSMTLANVKSSYILWQQYKHNWYVSYYYVEESGI